MNLLLTIKLALSNINQYKMRSGLTMLGLIIGIASVILLVGIGKGATDSIYGNIAGLGGSLLNFENWSDEGLPYYALDEIAYLPDVESAAPSGTLAKSVSRGARDLNWSNLIATNGNYCDIMDYELDRGRSLSEIDVENRSKVVVIGHTIAEKLFGAEDPIGKAIRIGGNEFTVIGILKGGDSVTGQMDSMLLIPISTIKYLGEKSELSSLYVKADSEDVVSAATEELNSYIEENFTLDKDYYNIYTNTEIQDSINQISTYLSMLLGGIASISLIVGGIGIMNVMYVTVSERTREIGIRKSLGARKKDIMKQFLIESLVLSLIGGIIGILFGLLGGAVINIISGSLYSISIFKPTAGIAVLSFSVSAGIGLIFGLLPSYRAACMRPIDALKQE